MKILIDIAHPADVHSFKNVANLLIANGNNVLFTTSDRPMIPDLLKHYNFDYKIRGHRGKGIIDKIFSSLFSIKNLFIISMKFKPDIYFDRGTMVAGIIAKFRRKPYIVIGDSESGKKLILIIKALADVILTGESFYLNVGQNHIKINTYMELFYLSPKRYIANSNIKTLLKLKKNEKYIILRFVAWDAYHDHGEFGIPVQQKIKFIERLSKYAKVFITSESNLPYELKKYEIDIPFDRMIDALAFAEMYIGEGATMASEAAVLGTPSIYINSIELGYCTELEKEYDLLYHFKDVNGALEKAEFLLKNTSLKEDWAIKKDKMLGEKIDGSAFLTWFIEKYPASHKTLINEPDYQYNFR